MCNSKELFVSLQVTAERNWMTNVCEFNYLRNWKPVFHFLVLFCHYYVLRYFFVRFFGNWFPFFRYTISWPFLLFFLYPLFCRPFVQFILYVFFVSAFPFLPLYVLFFWPFCCSFVIPFLPLDLSVFWLLSLYFLQCLVCFCYAISFLTCLLVFLL